MGLLADISRRFADQLELTRAQRNKEFSLLRAIVLDFVVYAALVVSAILSGSLTILAEVPRGGLLLAVEVVSLVTLRRSHRGLLSAFEYGIGKIERVIGILISGGLFVAALVTVNSTIARLQHPEVLPTPAMIFGVLIATTNLVINTYCLGDFARSNVDQPSLILESQVRSRLVKTISSLVVVLVLVAAIWLPDPVAAGWVDALGAVFVSVYMVVTGVQMLRESLPDLLDQALPEQEQLKLMGVMSQYYGDFLNFGSIRSRRSGGHAYIDIELEFEHDLMLSEVNRRCRAIRDEVKAVIPDAFVSVTPHAPGAAKASR
jgi:cation diffusion facilitator family transporter